MAWGHRAEEASPFGAGGKKQTRHEGPAATSNPESRRINHLPEEDGPMMKNEPVSGAYVPTSNESEEDWPHQKTPAPDIP